MGDEEKPNGGETLSDLDLALANMGLIHRVEEEDVNIELLSFL